LRIGKKKAKGFRIVIAFSIPELKRDEAKILLPMESYGNPSQRARYNQRQKACFGMKREMLRRNSEKRILFNRRKSARRTKKSLYKVLSEILSPSQRFAISRGSLGCE
jgi:hypothetical protein